MSLDGLCQHDAQTSGASDFLVSIGGCIRKIDIFGVRATFGTLGGWSG